MEAGHPSPEKRTQKDYDIDVRIFCFSIANCTVYFLLQNSNFIVNVYY